MLQWWGKLQQRERLLLLAGALFLLIAFLYKTAYLPFEAGKDRFRKGIAAKEKQYGELLQLRQEFRSLQEQSKNIAEKLRERESDFTLFAFLEKASDEAGVKPHIKYMKPSTSSGDEQHKESQVEMKLEKITLPQLAEYLQRIEVPEKSVFVKRLSMKRSSEEETGLIDVIVQAVTYI